MTSKNLETEARLRKEINKWTKKIEKEIKKIKLNDKTKKRLLDNIHAYIKDSKYFMNKGELIRSFEAIVWAWSWLEILKELGVLK